MLFISAVTLLAAAAGVNAAAGSATAKPSQTNSGRVIRKSTTNVKYTTQHASRPTKTWER
eukprot:jgi/Hompol1/3259/HPOL_006432-RA